MDELEEILEDFWKAGGVYDHVSGDMAGARGYIDSAKHAIQAHYLSLIPEKKRDFWVNKDLATIEQATNKGIVYGYNQAIDQITKSIKGEEL